VAQLQGGSAARSPVSRLFKLKLGRAERLRLGKVRSCVFLEEEAGRHRPGPPHPPVRRPEAGLASLAGVGIQLIDEAAQLLRLKFKAALIAFSIAVALMVIWLGMVGSAQAQGKQVWTHDHYKMAQGCLGRLPVYGTPDGRQWVWQKHWAPVGAAWVGACPSASSARP
jgi:hypothetical protein